MRTDKMGRVHRRRHDKKQLEDKKAQVERMQSRRKNKKQREEKRTEARRVKYGFDSMHDCQR
jgi:hypothetical protein